MTENTQPIPVPLVAGKFTLYQTPKGGMHLTMLVDGESEPRHLEVPAMMVKIMMRKAGQFTGPDPVQDFALGALTNGIVDTETIDVPNVYDPASFDPEA